MSQLSSQIKHDPDDSESLAALIQLATDPQEHPIVRTNATAQLGVIAGADRQDLAPQVVPVLRELLSSPDGAAQTQAARALGKYGEHAGSAIPDLFEILESVPNSGAAAAAALSLCEVGAPPATAVPALVAFVARAERLSPSGVCAPLSRNPAGRLHLFQEVSGSDERRRAAAIWFFAEAEEELQLCATTIPELMKSADPSVRWMAASAALYLSSVATPELIEVISRATNDGDTRVRFAAIATSRALDK